MSMLPRAAALVLVTGFVASLSPAASAAGPRPCGRPQAASLVRAFVSAFNRGDERRLDALFGRADRFRWYSVAGEPGERFDPAARDRTSLLPYFAARHAAGEQLSLLSLTFEKRSLGFLDFTYSLSRVAGDLPGPVRYGGKGAVICFAGPPALAVWSMGPDAPS